MTKRLVRILVYSSCALLFAGEAAQPAPPVAQQKSSQPARSVAAKGTPKPAPVPAVLTPTPLVMAMHQLNLKITKSEVLENIKDVIALCLEEFKHKRRAVPHQAEIIAIKRVEVPV